MKSITSTSLAQTLAVFCLLFGFTHAVAQGWERIYDLAPSEKFNDGIQTQDGGFVMAGTAKNGASGFDSLLVMVRTDFAGDEIWRRAFLMSYQVYHPLVEQLSDGSLALVYGAREDGYDQLRIRRISAWGDLLYDNLVIEAPVLIPGGAMIRPKNGDNLLVGGSRLIEIDAEGNIAWIVDLPWHCTRLEHARTGGFFASGTTVGQGIISKPVLSKWSSQGENLWTRTFQNVSAAGDFTSIIELPDSTIVLSAEWLIPTLNDGNLIKTDHNGNVIASVRLVNGTVTHVVLLEDETGFAAIHNNFFFSNRLDWFTPELDTIRRHVLEYTPSQRRYFRKMFQAEDGGFYLMGNTGPDVFSRGDFVLVKTNDQGSLFSSQVKGRIATDDNGNCQADTGEPPVFQGFTVHLHNSSDNYYTNTRPDGSYAVSAPVGDYELSVYPPSGSTVWMPCQPVPVSFPAPNTILQQDIAITPLAHCPELTVQISAPLLRLCLPFYVYVQYANLGSSAAHDAFVQVRIPDEMIFLESNLPLAAQTGNVLSFDLGELLPGETGAFSIVLQAPCEIDLLGQNVCVEAHIFPDSSCISPSMWSGAVLETEGHCVDDAVHFTIRNAGGAPTQNTAYSIARNDQLLLQAPLALTPGQETAVSYPGAGAVWRVIASQEPSYPGPRYHSTAVEQCGVDSEGNTNSEFFHWFSNDNQIRFLSEVCRPYQAAYDPNDKQASPRGYSQERLIEADTRISYRIRFQNTGNDTAFIVVLRDTLSPWLDPATLRPGASSHPCRIDLSGQGVLKFTFENIMLPDSATNEAASQGFVDFSILPRSDAPLGTQIINSAAIYFDFNPPIFTNPVWHTIGEFAFPTQDVTIPPREEFIQLKILPNPAFEYARFDWAPEGLQSFLLEFWNVSGQRMQQYRGIDTGMTFHRGSLSAGVYFYKVTLQDGRSARGKLLLR